MDKAMTAAATKARLYGIGAGPGDPGLVTRKAWQVVSQTPVIAYPAPEGGTSFARTIMAGAIADGATEIAIEIPICAGRAPAQGIYDNAAARIESHLVAGRDVAVLCEGDGLFYGSFMYILARLRENYPTEIIPGVTSLTACAAAHRKALAARGDILTVIPATLDDAAIASRIETADSIAIIKLGRHLPRMRKIIAGMGLAANALYVSHASLPHEKAMPLADAPDDAPYFSMILIYRGDDPWI